MERILIGIQCRASSTRLPRKAFERINNKSLVDRIIYTAYSTKKWLEKSNHYKIIVALLVPEDEIEIWECFKSDDIHVIPGSHTDVLSRYVDALDYFLPDYIIRLTADCPFIKPSLIKRHIEICIDHKYDYVTNSDPRYRTMPDGYDVEILSAPLLNWIGQTAISKEFREHVTLILKQDDKPLPNWIRVASILENLDFTDIKLSVDTIDDLNSIKERASKANEKISRLKKNNIGVFYY